MLTLNNRASISRALSDFDLDADLRALVGLRAWEFYVGQDNDRPHKARLFAIQGGDTSDVIDQALGFSITAEGPEAFAYCWIKDHGLWFEIAYDLDPGRPVRVFVENGPATELAVHALCLSHFWTPDEGGGA